MAEINEKEFNQGYLESAEKDVILVDSREERSPVFGILDREGIPYKRVTLDVGDFVYGNICIERKTVADFAQSIQTGHLQKQLLQMQDNYEMGFLIISGHWRTVQYGTWSINHQIGALASISARYPKIKVLQVDNDEQLVKLVKKICEKYYDGKEVDINKTEVMKIKLSIDDVKKKMLTCIPGISTGRADILRPHIDIRLTSSDGTPLQEKYLLAIENVGKSTVSELMNFNASSVKMQSSMDIL